MNSCWFVGFWLSLFLFIGFLWCFCCFSLVFMFFRWFSVVFGGILNSKMKICKTGQHYKFQCVATWNHSIAIQSAYFRVKKMHAKFSQSCVFFSTGVPKSNEKKITIFEAHMQPKVQFTAYLQGFMNPLSPRRLKTVCFFFKIVSYFFPHWRWKPRKNRGQKSLLKSNLECWQNCLWFSIVFHCFSLFLLWFFIGFCGSHWFFLDVFIDFLWFSINFMCCSLLLIVFVYWFSLVFLVFFFGFRVLFVGFHLLFNDFFGFLYHSLMFL